MGGQQFNAVTPESFLFGELTDLNYLSRLPGAVRLSFVLRLHKINQ
jgi:hypothetical protein